MSKSFLSSFFRTEKTEKNTGKFPMLKGFGLVIMGATIFFAAWLLVQDTVKKQFVESMNRAVAQGQIHIFVKHTDWQAVRKGLKDDLQRRAIHNASLPQDKVIQEKLVEYYVRPENVPDLLHYYNSKAAHMQAGDFVRRIYFSGLTEITVEIASPPQLDKPWLNHQEPTRAVFRLEGMKWVLKELDAPDYLIPTQAPTTRHKIVQAHKAT